MEGAWRVHGALSGPGTGRLAFARHPPGPEMPVPDRRRPVLGTDGHLRPAYKKFDEGSSGAGGMASQLPSRIFPAGASTFGNQCARVGLGEFRFRNFTGI